MSYIIETSQGEKTQNDFVSNRGVKKCVSLIINPVKKSGIDLGHVSMLKRNLFIFR